MVIHFVMLRLHPRIPILGFLLGETTPQFLQRRGSAKLSGSFALPKSGYRSRVFYPQPFGKVFVAPQNEWFVPKWTMVLILDPQWRSIMNEPNMAKPDSWRLRRAGTSSVLNCILASQLWVAGLVFMDVHCGAVSSYTSVTWIISYIYIYMCVYIYWFNGTKKHQLQLVGSHHHKLSLQEQLQRSPDHRPGCAL